MHPRSQSKREGQTGHPSTPRSSQQRRKPWMPALLLFLRKQPFGETEGVKTIVRSAVNQC